MSVLQVFEENMKQKQAQLQQLRENLLSLIEENPDSPEAEKWKHMLAQIGMRPSHPNTFIYFICSVDCQVQRHTRISLAHCEPGAEMKGQLPYLMYIYTVFYVKYFKLIN